jgi:hypothetical protein
MDGTRVYYHTIPRSHQEQNAAGTAIIQSSIRFAWCLLSAPRVKNVTGVGTMSAYAARRATVLVGETCGDDEVATAPLAWTEAVPEMPAAIEEAAADSLAEPPMVTGCWWEGLLWERNHPRTMAPAMHFRGKRPVSCHSERRR